MASDDCHGEMEPQHPLIAPTAFRLLSEVGASAEPWSNMQPVDGFLAELWEAARRPAPEPNEALRSVLASGFTAPVIPLGVGERRHRGPSQWRRTLTVVVAAASTTAVGANVAAAAGFVDRSSPGPVGAVVRALVPFETASEAGSPDADAIPAGGSRNPQTLADDVTSAGDVATTPGPPTPPGNTSGKADGAAAALSPPPLAPVPAVPGGPAPPPAQTPLPTVASPEVGPPELSPIPPTPGTALPTVPALENDPLAP